MRKKTLFLIIPLLLIGSYLIAGDWEQAVDLTKDDTGRYRLFQGCYTPVFKDATGKVSSCEEKAVFKIDSKTSETWVLQETVKAGEDLVRTWLKIN